MYQRLSSRSAWLMLVIGVLLFSGCPQPQQISLPIDSPNSVKQPQQQQPLVVFLVRHAEKIDDSRDAELSPDGATRADLLTNVLRDCNLEKIHSTDFARTRDTAAPTSRQLNLEVQLYDAADPTAMAEQLRSAGGRHLVVGHSNTVPEMVKLLGGDPGPAIDDSEYDRLYVVMIGGDGKTTTVTMRFGKRYTGDDNCP